MISTSAHKLKYDLISKIRHEYETVQSQNASSRETDKHTGQDAQNLMQKKNIAHPIYELQ